jgi:hypothetical protein
MIARPCNGRLSTVRESTLLAAIKTKTTTKTQKLLRQITCKSIRIAPFFVSSVSPWFVFGCGKYLKFSSKTTTFEKTGHDSEVFARD